MYAFDLRCGKTPSCGHVQIPKRDEMAETHFRFRSNFTPVPLAFCRGLFARKRNSFEVRGHHAKCDISHLGQETRTFCAIVQLSSWKSAWRMILTLIATVVTLAMSSCKLKNRRIRRERKKTGGTARRKMPRTKCFSSHMSARAFDRS